MLSAHKARFCLGFACFQTPLHRHESGRVFFRGTHCNGWYPFGFPVKSTQKRYHENRTPIWHRDEHGESASVGEEQSSHCEGLYPAKTYVLPATARKRLPETSKKRGSCSKNALPSPPTPPALCSIPYFRLRPLYSPVCDE